MTDRVTSPFGARTTAEEVLAGHDMRGQRFLVTGGYSGLGLETCRVLAAANADVVVAGRDLTRAGEAAVALRGLGAGDVEPMEVDLCDPASIDRAAEGLGHTALRAIVANAGVMATPLQRTAQGWEWQLAINLLGHARLVWRLLPALRHNEGRSRVVMLSSSAHQLSPFHADDPHFRERPYDKWHAYGQSKTADSLFAVAMQATDLVDGLDCFAVHPGGILTPLQRHLTDDEQVALGFFDEEGTPNAAFKTVPQGASTQVWAATDPALDELGGRYLEDCAEAAPYDPEQRRGGVREWAVDPSAAEQVWRFCERELELTPGS